MALHSAALVTFAVGLATELLELAAGELPQESRERSRPYKTYRSFFSTEGVTRMLSVKFSDREAEKGQDPGERLQRPTARHEGTVPVPRDADYSKRCSPS